MNAKVGILFCTILPLAFALNGDLISNFTVKLVQTEQAVVLGCSESGLMETGKALNHWNQVILLLNLKRNYSLENALTRQNRAKTSVILDCTCQECRAVLQGSSDRRYFNKTYQWMIWDPNNHGLSELVGQLLNIGPNSQMTYANKTASGLSFSLFDVHSMGRHLKASIEAVHFADWKEGRLSIYKDIKKLQGIQSRNQFNELTLRGAIVIDRDNITTNEQINSILSSTAKEDGVARFIKYHYDLLCFLQERFNFTLNYRNSRGWAGRLGGGTFRLGLLGVISRNEVDIGASGAFNRINRFAEFDTIHQSWKFDSAFVYRFTTELDANARSGNFLAPFATQVWAFSCVTIIVVLVIWRFAVWLITRGLNENEEEIDSLPLKALAAVCQQGLDPIPKSLPSRTIIFTLFVFSLVMYNYYTSSVVGGLLSSSEQGPKTIAEVVNSPLKLAFEDVGYYKVMFRESKSELIRRMYRTKVLPKRQPDELQVFTRLQDAIPFMKKGGYAFHCELVDAYPEIARLFDASEICSLRIVSGLLETELINWIVPKNSMYTEIFRIMMCRAREIGVVKHTLTANQPKKPHCQSAYTVYPVTLSGVMSAFILLGVGMLTAITVLAGEIIRHRIKEKICQ